MAVISVDDGYSNISGMTSLSIISFQFSFLGINVWSITPTSVLHNTYALLILPDDHVDDYIMQIATNFSVCFTSQISSHSHIFIVELSEFYCSCHQRNKF